MTSSEANIPLEDDIQLRAQIDRSLRFPLLFFFTSAAVWLVFGSLLGFVAALNLNAPSWFERLPWLTYGRVQPAHMNALIYGWGMQAGIGVCLWIMARLSRSPLRNPATLIVMGHVWNITISIGLISILAGFGTSIPWLDFPAATWPVLLGAYALVVLWMLGMAAVRQERSGYVSQSFIVGAIFWFPWIFITANLFIHHFPGAAVMKTAISGWYTSNMIFMVLGSMALAASYYIVPKVIGRPLFSNGLASVSFWTLVLFAGWTGMNRYMGGPLPVVVTSIGSAASIWLIIPALAVLYNQVKTMGDRKDWAAYSPALRFSLFGTFSFVVTVLLGILLALYPTGKTLQFSNALGGYELLAVYGFFSMTMFGAIYFIVPRICGCEWLNGEMIRFHFWFSAYGIITIVSFMFLSGLAQGHVINSNWSTDFSVAVDRGRPYLVARTVGWFFIGLSNILFLWHLAVMSFSKGRSSAEGPTLIHMQPEEYFEKQPTPPTLVQEGAVKA